MQHIETSTVAVIRARDVPLPGMQRRARRCMKIIPGRVGRGGCEYWTMRCTRCGGIHLDIVEPRSDAQTA